MRKGRKRGERKLGEGNKEEKNVGNGPFQKLGVECCILFLQSDEKNRLQVDLKNPKKLKTLLF